MRNFIIVILAIVALNPQVFAAEKFDIFSLPQDTQKSCQEMMDVGSAVPGETIEIKKPYDDMLVYFATYSNLMDGSLIVPRKVGNKYFMTMPFGDSIGKRNEVVFLGFTNGKTYCSVTLSLTPMETGLSFDYDEYIRELKKFVSLNARMYGSDYETLKITVPEDPRFFRLAAVIRAIENLEKSEPSPEVAHYLNKIGLIENIRKFNQDLESKSPIIDDTNRDDFQLKKVDSGMSFFTRSNCSYYENPYEIKDDAHLSMLMSKQPTLKSTEDLMATANFAAGLYGLAKFTPFGGAITLGVTAISIINKYQQAFVPNKFTEMDFNHDDFFIEDSIKRGYVYDVFVKAQGPDFDITRNSMDLVNALMGAVPGWGYAYGVVTFVVQSELAEFMDQMAENVCFKIKEKEWGPIELTEQKYYSLKVEDSAPIPAIKITRTTSTGGKDYYEPNNVGTSTLTVDLEEEMFGGKTFTKRVNVEVREVYVNFEPAAINVEKTGTTETFEVKLDVENPKDAEISLSTTAGEIVSQRQIGEKNWEVTLKTSDKVEDYPITITGRFEGKTLPENASRTGIAKVYIKEPSIEVIAPDAESCVTKGNTYAVSALVDGTAPPYNISWNASNGMVVKTSELGADWSPDAKGSHTITATLTLVDGRTVSGSTVVNAEEKCGNIEVKYFSKIVQKGVGLLSSRTIVYRFDEADLKNVWPENEAWPMENLLEVKAKEAKMYLNDSICSIDKLPTLRVAREPESLSEPGIMRFNFYPPEDVHKGRARCVDKEGKVSNRSLTFVSCLPFGHPDWDDKYIPFGIYKIQKSKPNIFDYEKKGPLESRDYCAITIKVDPK